MNAASEMLEASGLVKAYGGKRVVDRVDVKVNRQEIVGLLGPNGAGKTTTFYMVVGLTRPSEGRVFLDGTDITRDPMFLRARKGVSYLAQEPSVFRKLTVEQNLLAIIEMLHVPVQERRERVSKGLRELSISHL
ncbi:MAG TPA: ATP-binding cassette domain-containing protein, partial [Desulfobacteria bacterium]|nr:ATP-binding cassette domain-containing protein [Desulfobacteria bacterium]